METPELDGDLLRLSWSLLLPFMFYFHKFPLSQVGGGWCCHRAKAGNDQPSVREESRSIDIVKVSNKQKCGKVNKGRLLKCSSKIATLFI